MSPPAAGHADRKQSGAARVLGSGMFSDMKNRIF